MSEFLSSYIFYQVFVLDTAILQDESQTKTLLYNPYNSLTLSLPASLKIHMAVGYAFDINDEEDLNIQVVSPSQEVIETIPLGEIIFNAQKVEREELDGYILNGSISFGNNKPMPIKEPGYYIFKVLLGDEEINRTYLDIEDKEDIVGDKDE